MKSLAAAAATLLITVSSHAHAQSVETLVDRIVAIVDGYPILHSAVKQKVDKGPLVVVSDYPADENSQQWDRALQDAINFELVMSKAKDLEIDVRDDEVEAEIKSFLDSRGLGRDGLLQHLEGQGMSYEDYKEDFKDQMILRRFQGRVIHPLVKLTDKDVETYYLKKTGATSDLVELKLRQILFNVVATSAPDIIEAKRKLAQEVHQKLNDGMPFPDAVRVYSDDEKARETGGLMAGIHLRDMAPAIRTEVETLEAGQFTPPIRTAMGFHIFYLEEKQFSGSKEFATQKKQLEYELRTMELNNQTRRWLTEQRQRTKVEILKE